MFRSPPSVYLDSDFCFCPDPMSYSTTWKNFQPPVQKPKRGLQIVSENSQEDESDRDSGRMRVNGKEREFFDENICPRIRNWRISRRLIFIILFPVLFGLLGFALHRYQTLFFHSPLKRESSQKDEFTKIFHKDRLQCSHHQLLGRKPDGSFFYSLEAALPLTVNQSTKIYGFYQAFSETGKRLESTKLGRLEKKNEQEFLWKAEEKGSLDRRELVDHYTVTVFLEHDRTISKLQFNVHCPEKEIRRQIEDSDEKENESRREIDDRIVQALICLLCFVLGAVISKYLLIQ